MVVYNGVVNVDYLVIGGGIAGTTAAETLRTQDQASSIVILENEAHPLYSRVQIPYYLRGIKTRSDIFLRTLENYQEKNITYQTNKEVTGLDTSTKTVTTSDNQTYTYKKLLITTGGSPKKLNKYKKEHSMQTVEDADNILADIKTAKSGVVVGSGFIALEFMETFMHHGLPTSLCVSKDGFWSSFLAKEVSDVILRVTSNRGVAVHRGTTPDFIDASDTIVGTGIGIDVSRSFIQKSGLHFDLGLVCDEFLRTVVPEVFVAGDLAKFFSKKLNRLVKYGNWTNALMSGKTAALNMLSIPTPYDNLSAYSIKPQGLAIVFLGFAGIDDKTVTKTEVYSDTECAQFFIRDGKLDGCILVNKSLDRAKYQAIIESREPFTL